MSHDLEAAYAAAELATVLAGNPAHCFDQPPPQANISAYATKEGRHQWPHADGVIGLAATVGGTIRRYNVALEFKRPNEGTHGVLTALGQSHAYIRKGYNAAVMVIPESYPGLNAAGTYLNDVLSQTSQARNIGVVTYAPPDMSKVSPFEGRLVLHRPLFVDIAGGGIAPAGGNSRVETQWAHVREGSTEPDAFFRYLQSIKLLGGGDYTPTRPVIPQDISDAVDRLLPGADVEKYLSYTIGDSLPEAAWRHFWFRYVLHPTAINGWSLVNGQRVENSTSSLLERVDGAGPKLFMVGRRDSPKNTLSAAINDGTLTEALAYERLASKYRDRAHSYREDIDSGCQHLGFVDDEGRLTETGYRFVDACERFGSGNAALPRALFLNALLTDGGLGALLHYVYRLSEERFRADPLDFAQLNGSGRYKFQSAPYLAWLEGELADRLHVLRKVSARGGVARKPLQAELALLRQLGIVEKGYRIGLGLPVNWPMLQAAMSTVASAVH